MNYKRPSLMMMVVVLLTAFCLPPTAFSQAATASLSGTVEDQNGAVVPGAAIVLQNTGTSLKREATTTDEGFFTIVLIPPGTYTLTVRRDGFTPVEIHNVVLNVADRKALQIQLKAGNITEMVRITGEAPLINESPAVGTIVDRQFAANIPLNGRSFQSLISLAPGVVVVPANIGGAATNSQGQFSVNGQRAEANAFLVDGVSANYGASPLSSQAAQTGGNLPGLTAFGTTQSLVSLDAMQEFRVQTSTYAAEYGRQPGGQISIVTRSGTNDFHGSLFNYLRNDKFDANNWFANANRARRPAQRQNDFGGTFSGPILLPRLGEGGHQPGYDGRNRTFFFFSYEGLRLRLPIFTLTNVPSLALRQQAPAATQSIVNAFPLPNGKVLPNGLAEFSASYSDPSTLDATSIRVDHTINKNISLFGRYNQAPSETAARATSNLNVITRQRIETKTATLGVTALIGPRLSADVRVNYSDNFAFFSNQQENFFGAVPLPRNVLIPAQYDSSSSQGVTTLRFSGLTASAPAITIVDRGVSSQRQFNLVSSLDHNWGSHRLKFGLDYRRLTPRNAVNSYRIQAGFRNTSDVLNAIAGTANNIQANLPTTPIFVNVSAFGQDTWKASPRLTLDFGLRWDVNPAPGEVHGNTQLAVTQIANLATMQLAPRGASVWATTYQNFAPRFGAAYQLRNLPGREAVVRGGFGVFFDTGNAQGARQFSNFPFASRRNLTTLPFPIVADQVAPAPLAILQPTIVSPYGVMSIFDPNLKLPYTLQWNVAFEQSVRANDALTLSYVGSSGRRLLQLRRIFLNTINPSFTDTSLTTNSATSDYHSLQAQFQRRLFRGLQALASYTWSHAIDDDSQSFTQRVAQRGDADFDIRHNFAAALTYDIPFSSRQKALDKILGHWSFDTSIHARSALPVDVIASSPIDPNTGDAVNVRPNLIIGAPLYLSDATVPGGRKINPAAFQIPAAGESGNLGRNSLRGFAATQLDVALRRRIKLTEKLNLLVRAEAFNVFNHPNFGTVQTDLTALNFGQATNMLSQQLGGISQLYQIGGPRSLQFAVRLQF